MDDLQNRIEAHRTWIASGGRKGKQLVLDEFDLRPITDSNFPIEQSFLSGCNFSGIHFKGTDFYCAELYSCDFSGAVFEECSFYKTTMDFCSFKGAKFTRCSFNRMDSSESDYEGVIFENSVFNGINLMRCIMKNARLEQIDMSGAYIYKAQINGLRALLLSNAEKAVHLSGITDAVEITGNDFITYIIENI